MAGARINRDSIELGDNELAILQELEDKTALEIATGETIIDEVTLAEDDEGDDSQVDDLDEELDEDAELEEIEELDEPEEVEDEPEAVVDASKGAQAERRKAKKKLKEQREEYEQKLEALRVRNSELENSERITKILSKVTGHDRDKLEVHIRNSQVNALVADGMAKDKAERYADAIISEYSRSADAEVQKPKDKNSLEESAKELAKDKMFVGVKDHMDEVVEFANNSGISVKKAYLGLYHDEYMERYTKAKALARKHKQTTRGKHKVGNSKGQKRTTPRQSTLSADASEFYQEMGLDLQEMELLSKGANLEVYNKAMKAKQQK